MLSITDTTLSTIHPAKVSAHAVREFYGALLSLGVDRIEVTPYIFSLLGDKYAPSKSILRHQIRELPLNSLEAIPAGEWFGSSELRLWASKELFLRNYSEIFSELLKSHLPISFCTKNAGFAATALMAEWVQSGGENIACSFMGSGGYGALEEILLTLQVNGYPLPGIDTSRLKLLGSLWQRLTGETIPAHKPVVGDHIFEVESGIHINGIMKNTVNYEPFPPERVGAKRKFTLGKFSGKSSLMVKLQELKIKEKIQDPDRLLKLIQEKCVQQNRGISDREFFLLLDELNEGNGA